MIAHIVEEQNILVIIMSHIPKLNEWTKLRNIHGGRGRGWKMVDEKHEQPQQ